MQLFLDTAHRDSIKKWSFMIDGITTNPSNLSKEGNEPTMIASEICNLMKGRDVSIEVTETEPLAVYKQAHAIAKLASNAVVKIPCSQRYYEIIKKLVDEGISINVTLVFTLMQGLFMAKLGVKYISPFVGRWDDIDVEGTEILFELRDMMDTYGYATKILAASLRNPRHLHTAIIAGADVATVPVSVLEKVVEHPLTDQGIELFNADWKKVGNQPFPSNK